MRSSESAELGAYICTDKKLASHFKKYSSSLSHYLLLTDFGDGDDVKFEIPDLPGCVMAEQVWWWGGGPKRSKTLGHELDHVD